MHGRVPSHEMIKELRKRSKAGGGWYGRMTIAPKDYLRHRCMPIVPPAPAFLCGFSWSFVGLVDRSLHTEWEFRNTAQPALCGVSKFPFGVQATICLFQLRLEFLFFCGQGVS